MLKHKHETYDDNKLMQLVESWKVTLADEVTDVVTRATLHTVLYVADEIMHERAVLLPRASQVFIAVYTENSEQSQTEYVLEIGEGTVNYTTRWLLNQIILHLEPFITYKCVHKKFGTLIFRKDGDILTSLSWALGRPQSETDSMYTAVGNPQSKANILREAGDIVNDLVQAEIAKISSEHIYSQTNPSDIDIEQQIGHINQELWAFLESCTRTIRERKYGSNQEGNAHIKKLRRFYCLQVLMYCTNIQKPTMFHVLLADIIEMCGGSRKLIKVLNQIGAVASADTHDRFVTCVSEYQRERSVWDSLPQNVFSVASVDNFDMLQSHAAVFCGDQQRSYHGTTIQLVQPDPCTALEPQRESTYHQLRSHTEASQFKRKHSNSPANSPHKHGKVGPKRPRTVVPRDLTKSIVQAYDNTPTRAENSDVTLDRFLEQPNESIEREDFESKIFSYMFARHKLPNRLVLNDFKTLYAETKCKNSTPSNIHYMELLDEHPDSADTMRHVAEILLQNCSSVYQNGYVVLVGDGKTYEHLMKIKCLYGSELTKLLIFPGDWHILSNFQEVLMKIYYSAGLKELAMASGYRGETLASVARCSNFKRTHAFLSQVWQAMYRKLVACFCLQNESMQEALTDLSEAVIGERDVFTVIQPMMSKYGKAFNKFIQIECTKDDTFKFWYQYVFEDCFSYIALYTAIRCQNWKLRVSALKMMVPVFTAFDRTTYKQLLPHHLADIQTFPVCVLQSLQRGAFTVNILGRKGHAVALDEAHEMCINKDMKTAVVRPSKAYLQKTSSK